MILRDYQKKAIADLRETWQTHRAVCMVAPTGAGKTVLAVAAMEGYDRVLFLAHRRELISQAAKKLPNAGCICPGEPDQPWLPIQVASVQTLLARPGTRPMADLVVLDEAHHYQADEWATVTSAYPASKILGLTATPQRADGRPLGDMFTAMVVASSYSELIKNGYLVPARVFQPDRGMETNHLAISPYEAYMQLAPNTKCLAFTPRVEQCYDLAKYFAASGTPSAVVEANTPADDRAEILRNFETGSIKVVWNVQALTEGLDIPGIETIILARNCGHRGLFMQIAGRGLRPSPGKTECRFIDLCGVTLKFGFPDENTIYSLEGAGVTRSSVVKLRVCPSCGATTEVWQDHCPVCGYVPPYTPPPALRFCSVELREAFRGDQTADNLKRSEYQRLRKLAKFKGWSLSWVQKKYKELFGQAIIITDADDSERRREFAGLKAVGSAKGFKPGFAAVRYKTIFGEWPHRGM